MIISYNNGRPVYLSEVAEIDVGYPEVNGFTKRNGFPAYYLTLERGDNSNTVAILDEVNRAIIELNRDVLSAKGLETSRSFKCPDGYFYFPNGPSGQHSPSPHSLFANGDLGSPNFRFAEIDRHWD